MEVQLQELLNKINEDGVKKAEGTAAEIIEAAHAEARRIQEEARESVRIEKEKTQRELTVREESVKASLEQASRDILLYVKKEIEALFRASLSESLEKGFREENLIRGILSVIERWEGTEGETEIRVPADLSESLLEELKAKTAEKLKKGVVITPLKSIRTGFRVSAKGRELYYDFSGDSLEEMFSSLLSPQTAELLKKANQT